MSVLGYVVLSEAQAQGLVDQAEIVVPEASLPSGAMRKARKGDLMWAKEPFHLYTPKRVNRSWLVTTQAIPGPRFGVKTPEVFRRFAHKHRYITSAMGLPRGFSRFTLIVEAKGLDPRALRCRIVKTNIDALLSEGGAA